MDLIQIIKRLLSILLSIVIMWIVFFLTKQPVLSIMEIFSQMGDVREDVDKHTRKIKYNEFLSETVFVTFNNLMTIVTLIFFW